MKKFLATVMAIAMLCAAPLAQAMHYGWAFMIYDLNMSIEIGDGYERTSDETLAQTNGFEKSGNVKPDLVLELYNAETKAQLFVYSALVSPYDTVAELTSAYAEDLGAIVDGVNENGVQWQILTEDQQFCGAECTRILSSFENVNAEYVLMLSEDHTAYIITMITFDGQKPDSQLEGITFGTCVAPTEEPTDAVPEATPDATNAVASGN